MSASSECSDPVGVDSDAHDLPALHIPQAIGAACQTQDPAATHRREGQLDMDGRAATGIADAVYLLGGTASSPAKEKDNSTSLESITSKLMPQASQCTLGSSSRKLLLAAWRHDRRGRGYPSSK